MEDQLDQSEVQFETNLVGSSQSQLFEIGESLGVENFTSEMRKSGMMRSLRAFVHKSCVGETANQLEYMRTVLETMASLKEEEDPGVGDHASDAGLAQQREHEERDRHLFGQQQNQNSFTSEPRSAEQAAGMEMFGLIRKLADANIAARRQLKIVGIIGDVKDNKSINYINLTSQVADAKASKYTDDEIARAIKKAISASSHLRTYFDTTEKMELSKMLGMLRDFYQEKSASELFVELGQLCQNPQEKSTDFLLRAMQTRQRTTAAAVAEGDLYNDKLVQGTFIRTVKTGLREESIRAQLAPHLSQGKTVEDSVLLRETNLADLEYEEKTKKQKRERKVTVAQATTSAPSFDEALRPILEGMTTLQRRMDEMQTRGATATTSNNYQRESSSNSNLGYRPSSNSPSVSYRRPAYRNSGQGRNSWRCENCRRDDLQGCWHCFNCGAKGHRASECTTSKN